MVGARCAGPLSGGETAPPAEKAKVPKIPVPEWKIRRWLWEVISLLALTAAGILFAIDLADGFSVTWSLYPLSAVAFLWVTATSVIFLHGRQVALVAALAGSVLAFLFVLSLMTTGRPWFIRLALPLVVLAAAAGAAIWAAVRRLHLPVLPAIAAAVLGCGVAAVGAEYILNRYLQLAEVVSWSLVALACAISLFLALLLSHRHLKERHADIRRFFHL